MQRAILACILVGIALTISLTDAEAQRRTNNTRRGAVVGGVTGAAIGGIANGGRGALIGSAIGLGVGSVMGSREDRRRGNYYWYNGQCWLRFRNGEFHPVSHRYCR